MAVSVNTEECTGCGACVEECPNDALSLVDGVCQVDEGSCVDCGICVDECPVEAIEA